MAALTTEEVLRDEAKAIHDEDLSGKSGKELYRALNELNSAALCLSGGGIRSAAFALGVIQALAVHPRPHKEKPVGKAEESLLAQFHYLSTVSGGGYIGSWLSAWIMRAGFPAVWRSLVGDGASGEESPVLTWLRQYSNFLTPKIGLMSPDTWAAAAIYVRNLLLNWLIIIPTICAVLLLLKIIGIGFDWFSRFPPLFEEQFVYVVVVALLCLAAALFFATRNRPTCGTNRATDATFKRFDLLPGSLFAILFSLILVSTFTETWVHKVPGCVSTDQLKSTACLMSLTEGGAAAGIVLYVVTWLVARPAFRRRVDYSRDLFAWAIAGAIYGTLIAIASLSLRAGFEFSRAFSSRRAELGADLGSALGRHAAQLLAEMIFVGLSSREEGSDADREWFGRAAGYYLVVALVWFLVMGLATFGLQLASLLFEQFKYWVAAIGGISGLITWIIGKSHLSTATGEAKNKKQISANLILKIAGPVFALVLLIVVSALLDQLLLGYPLRPTGGQVAKDIPHLPQEFFPLFWAFIAFGAFGYLASLFVNVNRFSLHAMYRNRSVRAFLGASNMGRHQGLFSDFDETDNPTVKELWSKEEKGRLPKTGRAAWQPFHVINMALNVVATRNLAWQERKAEPFTVSPLHSGSAYKAFRPSSEYGHKGRGISLGTAMTISGAAASPNMGYNSSPTVTLLLALFNVRLGWWLGNPGPEGDRTYEKDGPGTALVPLFYEAFGLTTDDRKYIYLSDGGHFENLGLYEMVRRRCRFIVVSDAGCDPEFAFEDLGNAVRKIGIDLGVTVRFYGLDELQTLKKDSKAPLKGSPYYAIGKIDYPAADGVAEQGLILYVKPAYHGTEKNAGIRSYATAYPAFPHEGTGDQWFSESQFESYRALGFEIMDDVLSGAIPSLESDRPPTLKNLISNCRWRLEVAASDHTRRSTKALDQVPRGGRKAGRRLRLERRTASRMARAARGPCPHSRSPSCPSPRSRRIARSWSPRRPGARPSWTRAARSRASAPPSTSSR